MTDQELLSLAAACGCDHAGMLNVPALEFNPAVREMCAADRCNSYGRCWTCPPHCGTLEEISEKAAAFQRGLLVQCTSEMEDDYDVEAMMDAEERLKAAFRKLTDALRETYPNLLPMTAGGCRICPKCTCPDELCRFPALAVPSMEAYGLVVSKVCEDAGMKYYYGPLTITFSACVLIS